MTTGNALVDELVSAGRSYEETCVLLARALEAPIRVLAANRVAARQDEIREQLDVICRETVERLGSDAALVTLIDDSSVATLGAFGMDHGTYPLDMSVCKFSVAGDQPVTLADMQAHIALMPESDHPTLRTYLGAPWKAGNQPVGTVCALGNAPREWTDEEEAFIKAQAARVTDLVSMLG